MMQRLPTDTTRQLENMIRIASVVAVDCSAPTPVVKVQFDENQSSDWLAYTQVKAGNAFLWMPPEIGDQVCVLNINGDYSVCVVLGGIFTSANKPDLTGKDFKIQFENGDFIHHDGANLTIKVSGSLTIDASKAFINCDTNVRGKVVASKDVVASGISLVSHRHKGVTSGRGQSGEPI